MSKAYDRIEWPFLKECIRGMGLSDKWCDLILLCVESVSYSLLLNGAATDRFFPSRGLRLIVDHPSLFIICAEYLSRLLLKEERDNQIHGLKVSRRSPAISHLLFADDCFILCRAALNEVRQIRVVLDKYCAASGQLVNFQKSGVLFSNNISSRQRSELMNALGVSRILSKE